MMLHIQQSLSLAISIGFASIHFYLNEGTTNFRTKRVFFFRINRFHMQQSVDKICVAKKMQIFDCSKRLAACKYILIHCVGE